MTPLAPAPPEAGPFGAGPYVAEPVATELLIEQARRRHRLRRRRAVTIGLAIGALGGYLVAGAAEPARRSPSLLSRPLRLPVLGPGGRCPASGGAPVATGYFNGVALGRGPVRVLLADEGSLTRGRVRLSPPDSAGWSAVQTLWYSLPGYDGPFAIRAAPIGGRGPIAVRPGASGLGPAAGPLIVGAGPTINTDGGYRTVPGSTWVRSPGCYGWQIDGRRFHETIVVDALASNG